MEHAIECDGDIVLDDWHYHWYFCQFRQQHISPLIAVRTKSAFNIPKQQHITVFSS